MRNVKGWRPALLTLSLALLLSACGSSTKITRVQALEPSADAPYKKVLVISLFDSFDTRIYLEKELVAELERRGIEAVASTSMMDSTVPAVRSTFVAMLDKFDADAILVSHMAAHDTDFTVKDMNPQSTHIFRPTYYYNVFSHELTEFVEPQSVAMGYSIVLATQVYSVRNRDAVWGIESRFRYEQDVDQQWHYSVFPEQAKSIVTELSRDGLIAE